MGHCTTALSALPVVQLQGLTHSTRPMHTAQWQNTVKTFKQDLSSTLAPEEEEELVLL